MYVCMYMVRIVRNEHARVIEAENSVTLDKCTSTTAFIVLVLQKVIMDLLMKILTRTMNT